MPTGAVPSAAMPPRAAPAGTSPARAWPRPAQPRLGARLAYRLQRLLAPNGVFRRLARLIEATGSGYRLFTAAEKAVKTGLFGCRMCGQCALPVTGYACPMTCPKQLRNGPCGGVGRDGSCEVYPGQRCVWLIAFERAESQRRVTDLQLIQRPIDQRQWGSSSWVNYWSGRDEGLWISPGHPAPSPPDSTWRAASPDWQHRPDRGRTPQAALCAAEDPSPAASEVPDGAPPARRTARGTVR